MDEKIKNFAEAEKLYEEMLDLNPNTEKEKILKYVDKKFIPYFRINGVNKRFLHETTNKYLNSNIEESITTYQIILTEIGNILEEIKNNLKLIAIKNAKNLKNIKDIEMPQIFKELKEIFKSISKSIKITSNGTPDNAIKNTLKSLIEGLENRYNQILKINNVIEQQDENCYDYVNTILNNIKEIIDYLKKGQNYSQFEKYVNARWKNILLNFDEIKKLLKDEEMELKKELAIINQKVKGA